MNNCVMPQQPPVCAKGNTADITPSEEEKSIITYEEDTQSHHQYQSKQNTVSYHVKTELVS